MKRTWWFAFAPYVGDHENAWSAVAAAWNAGNKITQHDVKAALMGDNVYREFKARRKNGQSGSPV